jgi:hypothetical protein
MSSDWNCGPVDPGLVSGSLDLSKFTRQTQILFLFLVLMTGAQRASSSRHFRHLLLPVTHKQAQPCHQ